MKQTSWGQLQIIMDIESLQSLVKSVQSYQYHTSINFKGVWPVHPTRTLNGNIHTAVLVGVYKPARFSIIIYYTHDMMCRSNADQPIYFSITQMNGNIHIHGCTIVGVSLPGIQDTTY